MSFHVSLGECTLAALVFEAVGLKVQGLGLRYWALIVGIKVYSERLPGFQICIFERIFRRLYEL